MLSVAVVGRRARVFVSQRCSLVERFVRVSAKDMALPNELIVGKECLRVEVWWQLLLHTFHHIRPSSVDELGFLTGGR